MNRLLMLGIFMLLVFGPAAAARAAGGLDEEAQPVVADRVSASVKIDGQLNEEVWSRAPIRRQWITFNPAYGEKLDFPTDVWLAYDGGNLYFAFRCHDPEPARIKTSLAKRDSGGSDDWVGVAIDGLNNRQSTFEFYVNPSGVQLDGMTSAMYADSLDIAHDFVWESAARIDAGGYTVEIRIPLESLRFKGGAKVGMGMMFFRHISRLGRMGSWPEIKVGRNQFHFLAAVVYDDLKKGLNLELLPNFTLNRGSARQDDDSWPAAEWTANTGLSLKYGLSSSVTAEAHHQSRFQPGGKRRVSGRSQPALPDFLQREAAFFHGRRQCLRFRTDQQRHDAGLGLHALHRRSRLGGQAERHRRPDPVRLAGGR